MFTSYKIQNEDKVIYFHLISTTRKNPYKSTLNEKTDISRYDDWNMAQHVDDSSQGVALHRKQLQAFLKDTFNVQNSINWLSQKHSNNTVDYEKYIEDATHYQYEGIDGLFTTQEKSPCCVMTADCVPIFLWNECTENPLVCVLHAGWQGILKGVIEQGVLQLKQKLNLNLNLKAFIGVHLSQNYFEVDLNVLQQFNHYINQKRKEHHITDKLKYFYSADDNGHGHGHGHGHNRKYYIDLGLVCNFLLQLLKVQIVGIHDDCTYQQEDLYYSHRRQFHQTPDNAMTGRMAHLIWFEKL